MKACKTCGLEKEDSEFGKNRSKCKPCYNSYIRAYYAARPGLSSTMCKKYRKKHGPKAFNKRRELLQNLKKGPCMDCGNSFPTECMDFDHRPGTDKKFGIAGAWSVPLERFLEEVAKCDIVCANCHRIRTYQRKLASK